MLLKSYKLIILWLLFTFSLFSFAKAQNESNEIIPKDVLQSFNKAKLMLNKISKYTGTKNDICIPFKVIEANPREVYFQAIRLEKKINNLSIQMTGSGEYSFEHKLNVNTKKISPNDVFIISKRINSHLLHIIDFIGLKVVPNNQEVKSATPTDVYKMLLFLNAVTDTLLDEKVSSSHIYEITNLAVFYMGEIIQKSKDKLHTFEDAKYSKYISLDELFNQQISIIMAIKKLAKIKKLSVLTIERSTCKDGIKINNIEELAYLILSEIYYIANSEDISLENIRSYYPGKKYIFNIFKLNELLLQQIKILEELRK